MIVAIGEEGQPSYMNRMSKAPKSWLPRRSASAGHFLPQAEVARPPRTASTDLASHVLGEKSLTVRSGVSGRIDLPNGQFITTVRKDVMDSALNRGEFKKK